MMTRLTRLQTSLLSDLENWSAATAEPPLDKHASQISAIVRQLDTALEQTLPSPNWAPDGNEPEQVILDFHHVWDFFRTKFALRYVPWYREPLAVADDLAWAAFRPVRDAARSTLGREIREPPLAYPSRAALPFAVPRGADYTGLLPRGGLWTERVDDVTRCLVVPVVSLPWHRFTNPAAILSVAHEVGHIVLADLDLLPALQRQLDSKRLSQPFHGWAEEVFADLFAATLCGSAAAVALHEMVTDTASPDYPPLATRRQLMLEVARRRATRPQDIALQQGTDDPVPPEVTAVVSAVLDHDLPGLDVTLSTLFPTVDTPSLLDDVERLRAGRDPQARTVTALLAAATHAGIHAGNHEAVTDDALSRAVQEHAQRLREVGRRAAHEDPAGLIRSRDVAAGTRLAALMRACQ